MANVKATDIVIIRDMLKDRENDLRTLTSQLTPDALKVFQTTLSLNWIPLAIEAEILQAAAGLFFPSDARPLFKLGHMVAGKQFTGIYKLFLRIPSVSFIVKNVSSTYNTLMDSGKARIDDLTSNGATFAISGLSELTSIQREYISGVITCILELAGAKNLNVVKVENNPQEWKCKISWK